MPRKNSNLLRLKRALSSIEQEHQSLATTIGLLASSGLDHTRIKCTDSLVLGLFLCYAAATVSAQDAAPDTSGTDSAAAIEKQQTSPITIIITPEWQPIDAQQASKTVDHFTGEELEASGVRDTIDLQNLTPGFVFKTNSVLGQPYLRGVGSDIISAGSEPSVATFIDGIYQPRAYDSIVDFFDVERVEVLKGPQGVTLGRNVTGGAVGIYTRDPEPDPAGHADLRMGDYNLRQAQGAVNLPIGNSKLMVRLAGAVARRDGYVDNLFLHNTVDTEDYAALRGKALYAPTQSFSLLFSAEHHSENSSRELGFHPDPTANNGGVAFGGIVPDDPRQMTANVDPSIDTQANRYSAKLTFKRQDLTFVSTSAYLHSAAALALDLDYTDVDFAANFPRGSSDAVTQEFRLSSQSPVRPLSWTTGVFFLREQADQKLDVRLPLAQVSNVPDGAVDTHSYALFGQIAYRFSSTWRGKAGIRHSRDQRSLDLVQTVSDPLGVLGPAGTTVSRQNERKQWQATTPELGLEYSPAKNRLYYLTVSRGYKAGGFNTSSVQPPFDPEFLWDYEAGVKTTFPQQHLRVNTALFHYDYENMQLDTPPTGAPAGTFPIVINAAKATIDGADFDVLFEPSHNVDLSLGATALFTARFDQFVSLDPNNPTSNPDHAGQRLPQAPDLSLRLGAGYAWPVSEGRVTLKGQYRYQSLTYYNIYQDETVRQGGYGVVDAGLTFEPPKGDWSVELYGQNLTDKLYAQNVIRMDPLTGTLRLWGAPRTVGLRVGYRW